MLRPLLALLVLALGGCSKAAGPPAVPPQSGYYSDYFVFVSDSPERPLVVPLDVNWEPRPGGQMFVEYKAWRGTAAPWPMAYLVETRARPTGAFPEHWAGLPAAGGFQFDGSVVRVKHAAIPSLTLVIPRASKGVTQTEESPLGRVAFTVWKTSLQDRGQAVGGWLIHERVRLDGPVKMDPSRPLFERFHWFPLVKGEVFYLVRHDSKRGVAAYRWQRSGDGLAGTRSGRVDMKVTATRADSTSGRAAVPHSWDIALPEFDARFALTTGAGHDGHGAVRSKGKALYRQALVTGDAHGMVELILED